MTLETLAQVLASAGFTTGLILFFVWTNHKREEAAKVESLARETRLGDRLNKLEDEMRGALFAIAERSAAIVAENTTAMRESSAALAVVREGLTAVHNDVREHCKMAEGISHTIESLAKSHKT